MPAEEYVDIFEFERGGLRVSDVDVEFMEARWGPWAYPGLAELGEQMTAIFSLKVLGQEEGELEEQVWTAGSLLDWEASDDGKRLRSLGPGHVRDSTNWSLFVASLKDKGLQLEKLDPRDITSMVGLQCHLVEEKVDRPGLEKDGRVLVCSQLIRAPWERKGTAKKRPAKKATTKATAGAAAATNGSATGEADISEIAPILLMEALTEGTPVETPELVKRVFRAAKSNGQQGSFMGVSKLIRDDAQLGPIVESLGFTLDGTTIT